MLRLGTISFITGVLLVVGCAPVTPPLDLSGDGMEPTILSYTNPGVSGLLAQAPYPNSDDICQLLAPNPYTDPVREEGRDLIACPKHEKGAIGDRLDEGARIVGYAKHWTILSVRP